MLLPIIACVSAAAYCAAYAVYCIKQGPACAAIAACLLAMLPVGGIVLCLI